MQTITESLEEEKQKFSELPNWQLTDSQRKQLESVLNRPSDSKETALGHIQRRFYAFLLAKGGDRQEKAVTAAGAVLAFADVDPEDIAPTPQPQQPQQRLLSAPSQPQSDRSYVEVQRIKNWATHRRELCEEVEDKLDLLMRHLPEGEDDESQMVQALFELIRRKVAEIGELESEVSQAEASMVREPSPTSSEV